MFPGSPLTTPIANEASEGFALLGWFGLMGLGIYALYLGLVVFVPLGIVTLVRPERGIDRPLVQSLVGCAALPPIGLGVAALTHTLFDTRGPSPNWSGLCTGAALVALPTLALMLAIPARRTTTLIAGLGVWAALAAISGAQDSTLGTASTSYLSDAIGWALVVWVVFAAFVLPAPLILSLCGVGRQSSGVGLAASLAACTACLPVAFLASGVYLEVTDREFAPAARNAIPISVLVIALVCAFACVIWPQSRRIVSVMALVLSSAIAIALTHWLSP